MPSRTSLQIIKYMANRHLNALTDGETLDDWMNASLRSGSWLFSDAIFYSSDPWLPPICHTDLLAVPQTHQASGPLHLLILFPYSPVCLALSFSSGLCSNAILWWGPPCPFQHSYPAYLLYFLTEHTLLSVTKKSFNFLTLGFSMLIDSYIPNVYTVPTSQRLVNIHWITERKVSLFAHISQESGCMLCSILS